MKKKGFTLIELLAVIVILAIIALIAVPIILNVVKTAKKGAAESSTYSYVEALNNYQVMATIKGQKELTEGTYEVSKANNDVKKINDLVQLKGTKPTLGTVTITKNKKIGGAILCINGFVVRYINNKSEVISDDCDDLGVITNYSIDEEGWSKSRNLVVEFPKGTYDYYVKVSGNAKYDGNTIEKNKALKVVQMTTIELLENQTIETWIEKNGKVLGKDSYIEEFIDSVVIVEPAATLSASKPIIKMSGISYGSEFTITSKQDGTTPYYSVDNSEWKEYTGKVFESGKELKVKMVRNVSKLESSVKTFSLNGSASSDSLSSLAFDGDTTTYLQFKAYDSYTYIDQNISVDSSVWGENLRIYFSNNYLDDTNYIIVTAYDSNGSIISTSKKYRSQSTTNVNTPESDLYAIPKNTVKLQFHLYSLNGYRIMRLHELKMDYSKYTPSVTNASYPIILKDLNAMENKLKINYPAKNAVNLYKINNGEWKEYPSEGVSIGKNDVLYAKSVLNSLITSNSDYNSLDLYPTMEYRMPDFYKLITDGDTSTNYSFKAYDTVVDVTQYLSIDSSMWNKNIRLYYSDIYNDASNYLELTALNSSGGVISTSKKYYTSAWGDENAPVNELYTIPENTVTLKIYMYALNGYRTMRLHEIMFN